MKVSVRNTYGCECTTPEGCVLTLVEPLIEVDNGMRLQQIRKERFDADPRNFYMLLDGIVYPKYASEETAYPVSSPYTSNDWTDYVNNWIYTDDVRVKLTDSTFFCWVYINDPVPNNVRLKVAKLEAGTTTKSVPANSHLILARDRGTACEIDGVLQTETDDKIATQIPIDSARDITINVSARSYLICMQSE